jgi:NADH-quinone oxidoreductase subunit G
VKTPNSEKGHKLLHTHYHNRNELNAANLIWVQIRGEKIAVIVCVGTSVYIRGSQKLLSQL